MKEILVFWTWKSRKNKMDEIKRSRRIMRDVFEKDADFKYGYVANVAMLLYDRYGITDFDERNAAATDILELIFYDIYDSDDVAKINENENKKINRFEIMDLD